jgi:hypothetical protein
MKIKLKYRLYFSALILTVGISFFLMDGCSQNTTMPNNSAQRKINVTTLSKDDQGKPTNIPIPNVTVIAIDPASGDSVDKRKTDNSGYAQLEFEAPAVGHKFDINAVNYKFCNNETIALKQVLSIFPCCKDTAIAFYFDQSCPPDLKCENLANLSDTLKILDENGSSKITQTTTSKYYTGFLTLFVNTGDLPIKATIPPASSFAPYELISPAAGSTVVLQKGEALSISVQLNAKNPLGIYVRNMLIQLSCQDGTAQVNVNLPAEIIPPACECLALGTKLINKESEGGIIGQPIDYFGEKIFDNNKQNCVDSIISIISKTNYGEWKVINYNKIIHYNEGLYVDFRFTPKFNYVQQDTFVVTYSTGSKICSMLIVTRGKGCVNACPKINPYNTGFIDFNDKVQVDISQTVRFSNTKCGSTIESNYNIPIYLDANSCDDNITVNVAIEDKEASKLAARFYKISTSPIYLNRGNTSSLVINFVSPTISEFDDIFTSGKRTRTGKLVDSMFTMYITLTPSKAGCEVQKIKITYILNTEPVATKPNLLHAYNEVSDKVQNPKKLVCWFDKVKNASTSEFIDKTKKGLYPPDDGDFYIDVDNNSQSLVKKEPYIKLCKQGNYVMDRMKYWRNMPEPQYTNIKGVITLLSNDFKSNPNLFSANYGTQAGGNGTPLQTGDVFIFYSDATNDNGVPCYMGLLWIAAINYGIESDQYHLTGITFQLIYPVEF